MGCSMGLNVGVATLDSEEWMSLLQERQMSVLSTVKLVVLSKLEDPTRHQFPNL